MWEIGEGGRKTRERESNAMPKREFLTIFDGPACMHFGRQWLFTPNALLAAAGVPKFPLVTLRRCSFEEGRHDGALLLVARAFLVHLESDVVLAAHDHHTAIDERTVQLVHEVSRHLRPLLRDLRVERPACGAGKKHRRESGEKWEVGDHSYSGAHAQRMTDKNTTSRKERWRLPWWSIRFFSHGQQVVSIWYSLMNFMRACGPKINRQQGGRSTGIRTALWAGNKVWLKRG